MGALEACVLIAMMASAPSLLLVAWLLWQAPLTEFDENSSSASTNDLSTTKTSQQIREY
jgi:hypothetical protein